MHILRCHCFWAYIVLQRPSTRYSDIKNIAKTNKKYAKLSTKSKTPPNTLSAMTHCIGSLRRYPAPDSLAGFSVPNWEGKRKIKEGENGKERDGEGKVGELTLISNPSDTTCCCT